MLHCIFAKVASHVTGSHVRLVYLGAGTEYEQDGSRYLGDAVGFRLTDNGQWFAPVVSWSSLVLDYLEVWAQSVAVYSGRSEETKIPLLELSS